MLVTSRLRPFMSITHHFLIIIIVIIIMTIIIIVIIIIIIMIIIMIIIINIYIAQIPCEYDQMRVTKKYDTNQT